MKTVKLVILSFILLALAQTASAQQWAVAVNAADMVSLGTISAEGVCSKVIFRQIVTEKGATRKGI